MKYIVFFLLFFNGLVTKGQQTHPIIGTVNDEKGMSVPGATVFLTKTQNATATNLNGKFILSRLTPGNYVLVINMIGFGTYSQNIKVQEKDITINAEIKGTPTIFINGRKLPKPYQTEDIKYFI